MKRRVRVLVAGWMLILAPASGYVGPAAQSGSEPRALLNRYCIACHNQKTRTAGLALDTMDVSKVGEHAEVWERVVRKLRGGLMPPAGRPRPEPNAYNGFINWLEAELDGAAALHPNPGRKETLHRLNRVEYRNAIRDLLALEVDETLLLPADDASYGFDNIAGILKIDQSRMERYLAAATKISRAALGGPPAAPSSETFVLPAELPQYDHIDGDFGTPAPKVIYELSENSKKLLAFAVARSKEVLEAAGATEILKAGFDTESIGRGAAPGHYLGTARMGTDPARSVVDKWGRAHDVKNLFIIDGSVFTTSGCQTPASTIQVIALRTADYIKTQARTLLT